MSKWPFIVFACSICVLAWKAAEEPARPTVPPPAIMQEQPITIPVVGIHRQQLVDTFTAARAGHRHDALDIMAERGTPVIAAVDGTVRKLFTSRAGGITIYEFDDAGTICYYYAHLDRYADGVREGLRVRRGDLIGYVGSTGNAPKNAPHLHFAMMILPPTKEWWKGDAVNPYPILMARGITSEATGR